MSDTILPTGKDLTLKEGVFALGVYAYNGKRFYSEDASLWGISDAAKEWAKCRFSKLESQVEKFTFQVYAAKEAYALALKLRKAAIEAAYSQATSLRDQPLTDEEKNTLIKDLCDELSRLYEEFKHV